MFCASFPGSVGKDRTEEEFFFTELRLLKWGTPLYICLGNLDTRIPLTFYCPTIKHEIVPDGLFKTCQLCIWGCALWLHFWKQSFTLLSPPLPLRATSWECCKEEVHDLSRKRHQVNLTSRDTRRRKSSGWAWSVQASWLPRTSPIFQPISLIFIP